MSYTVRNTLIILVLIVIISIGGIYFVSFRMQNDVLAVEKTLKAKEEELKQLRANNLFFSEVENRLENVRKAWHELPKKIYREENTAISFAYFNRLARQRDSMIFYNYSLNATRQIGKMDVNYYTLIGDASFTNLYNFIWKLEHYKPLYSIETLDIKPLSDTDKIERYGLGRIEFALVIRSFKVDQEGLEEQSLAGEFPPVRTSYNPCYPLIQETLPPNDENLLVVDNAILQGFTDNTAFLRDNQGNSWFLKIGDKVYLGSLTRIIPEETSVEFTLNEGGFLRKVVLKLFKD